MATQEIKSISVTIRVPTSLLGRIEARVTDRNNRTDVIIGLLEQALEENNSSLGLKKTENSESQKVLELEQKIHSLSMLIETVRQNITILDNAFFALRESVDGKISKVVDGFEARLVEVENKKVTNDRLLVNGIIHEILSKELDTRLPLIQQLQTSDLVQNLVQEKLHFLPELENYGDREPDGVQKYNAKVVENNLDTELDSQYIQTSFLEVESPEVLENTEVPGMGDNLPESASNEVVGMLGDKVFEESDLPPKTPEGIQPISARKLSKQRFGLRPDSVAGAKGRLKNVQSFIDWTRQKDPDGIAWKMVETPVQGYVPADELSSNLQNKLLTWMRDSGLL